MEERKTVQHGSGDVEAEDPRVTPAGLSELLAAGLLSREAHESSLAFIHRSEPPLAWHAWIQRILLFLGAALILSGVITFFAFNWSRMPVWVKFSLIEAGMLIILFVAWTQGLDTLTGRVLLLSAGVLVGVFLLVFGQVYQTGADAYELFQGWIVLIAGWVFISRFPAFWMIWIALIQTCLILYFAQIVFPQVVRHEPVAFLCLLLGLVNAAALVFQEAGRMKRIPWMQAPWPRWIYLAALLTCFSIPTCMLITEPDLMTEGSIPAAILLVLAVAGSLVYYKVCAPDLFAMTLCMLAICINLLTLIGKLVFEISDEAGMFLFFGFVVLGVFSAASFMLIRIARTMATGGEGHV
ncbi:MAG: DUF2157 domain-containing protein [Planctomycetota bacterium]